MSLRLRTSLACILVVAISGLAGCAKPSNTSANVSDLLEITYDSGPSIGIGDDLTFWIKNESNRCISFPADFGIKIFARAGQAWTAIPNLDKYVGEGPIQINPKGEVLSENFVGLTPDVSDLDLTAPTEFYASITGHLCDDESIVVEKQIPFTVTP